MNEILHANIFFFIASVGTVVFMILISVILYHAIKIMKIVRSILARVEEGSEIIAEDAARIRSFLTNGSMISRILTFFMNQSESESPKRSRRKSSTKRINNEDE